MAPWRANGGPLRPAVALACAATLALAWLPTGCSRSSLQALRGRGENALEDDPTLAGRAAPEPRPEPGPPPVMQPPPTPDPPRLACDPSTSNFIYAVSDTLRLHRFDPVAGDLTPIGDLDCALETEEAFSMAIDRRGNAYVLLYTRGSGRLPGRLVRASTLDASCERLNGYEPDQQGFGLFGMAFTASGRGDGTDTLYLMGAGHAGSREGLARLDTSTLRVSFIGSHDPPIPLAELAGSPDGRLFTLFTFDLGDGVWSLGELDRASGSLLWEVPLSIRLEGGTFAVARWDDDLYAFTGPLSGEDARTTTVTHYDTRTDTIQEIARLPNTGIVGVGTSSCAPTQTIR